MSAGFLNISRSEIAKEGINIIPIAHKVQNQLGINIVQLKIKISVSAIGIRLRRRLSKIFHRDKPDKGFL
jgi:hypothetical protein